MPYIKPEYRFKFQPALDMLPTIESTGELNYILSMIYNKYLNQHGTPNYAKYNDVMGAVLGSVLEMYRIKAAPYEDSKIIQNGPIS